MTVALLAASQDNPVARVLCVGATAYTLIMLARVLWSWFPPPRSGPARSFHDLLVDVTDPVLKPLRGVIKPVAASGMALDFSPILAFIILFVVRSVVC